MNTSKSVVSHLPSGSLYFDIHHTDICILYVCIICIDWTTRYNTRVQIQQHTTAVQAACDNSQGELSSPSATIWLLHLVLRPCTVAECVGWRKFSSGWSKMPSLQFKLIPQSIQLFLSALFNKRKCVNKRCGFCVVLSAMGISALCFLRCDFCVVLSALGISALCFLCCAFCVVDLCFVVFALWFLRCGFLRCGLYVVDFCVVVSA